MNSVAVLIAESQACLAAAPITVDRKLLPQAGEVRWLAPGLAFEVPFAAERRDFPGIEAELREALAGLAVDIALLPAAGRRKSLLLADMDSTVIEEECLDELAAMAGCRAEIAALTRAAMAGEMDFAASLQQRLSRLAGLERRALAALAERLTLRAGARTLTATMRAHGGYSALVSSGFTLFTAAIAKRAGFDTHDGNDARFDGGRLAGVTTPVKGAAAKADRLRRLCVEHGIAASDALAVGDGANDSAMIEAAGLGVAFHAKPALRETADVRIDHADLTALLYLQGYRRDAFVTGA